MSQSSESGGGVPAWVNTQMIRYAQTLREYTETYRAHVTATLSSELGLYDKYVADVFSTSQLKWFSFPQRLFNKTSQRTKDRTSNMSTNLTAMPSGNFPVEFGVFIGITEAERVHLWSRQFWETFEIGHQPIPRQLNMSRRSNDVKHFHCCNVIPRDTFVSPRLQLNQLNSYRYFASGYDAQQKQLTYIPPSKSINSQVTLSVNTEVTSSISDDAEVLVTDISISNVLNLNEAVVWAVYIVIESLLIFHRICYTRVNAGRIYSSGLTRYFSELEYLKQLPPQHLGGRASNSSGGVASKDTMWLHRNLAENEQRGTLSNVGRVHFPSSGVDLLCNEPVRGVNVNVSKTSLTRLPSVYNICNDVPTGVINECRSFNLNFIKCAHSDSCHQDVMTLYDDVTKCTPQNCDDIMTGSNLSKHQKPFKDGSTKEPCIQTMSSTVIYAGNDVKNDTDRRSTLCLNSATALSSLSKVITPVQRILAIGTVVLLSLCTLESAVIVLNVDPLHEIGSLALLVRPLDIKASTLLKYINNNLC